MADTRARRPTIWRDVTQNSGRSFETDAGQPSPTIPFEQLDSPSKRCSSPGSASAPSTTATSAKIPHDLGTAVNVQTMVFGNMGDDSRHWRRLHAQPDTGEQVLVRRLPDRTRRARTWSRASGRRGRSATSRRTCPRSTREFERIAERLERHYRDVQDLEFTIERGRLYMLQTREREAHGRRRREDRGRHGRRGHHHEDGGGLADRAGARRPVAAPPVRPGRAGGSATAALANGLNASPGAAVGKAVFDADRAAEQAGRASRSSWCAPRRRPTTSTAWRLPRACSPRAAARPATRRWWRGRSASRASPAVSRLEIDYRERRASAGGQTFAEGDWISLDGSTGEVFLGRVATVQVRFEDQAELQTILGWADAVRRLGVWANAD